MKAFETLHEEAKLLELKVSFGGLFGALLGEGVLSILICGVDIEIEENFTYLSSVGFNSGLTWPMVLWTCSAQVYIILLPLLSYSCETWTLNGELKQKTYAF